MLTAAQTSSFDLKKIFKNIIMQPRAPIKMLTWPQSASQEGVLISAEVGWIS